MALTLSQKILARASGGPAPQPGDMVVARVDRATGAHPGGGKTWMDVIATGPHRRRPGGVLRPELADGADTYTEQSHVIVFWEYAGGIEILRVLHTRMDLNQRLGPPNPSM